MRFASAGVALLLLSGLGLGKASGQGVLYAYIEAPASQSSSVAGLTGAETETFNSAATGDHSTPYSSAIGTFQFSPTAQGDVLAADQFGGANNTPYMAFGAESGTSQPITINLNGNYNYFGFYFSAGDANNGVTLYSNGTEFARFSTTDILALLSGSTVTSLNGTTYNSSAFYGNPSSGHSGQDGSEPFVYVEIVTTGQTFNTVVLDNNNQTGTGFETDNDTVYYGNVTVPGTDVFVSELTAVPEPRHYAMIFGAVILGLVAVRRALGESLQREVALA
jgi:hypothetical protein